MKHSWVLCLVVFFTLATAHTQSLPSGTRLRVQMQTPADTKTSHVGDAIEALLVESVEVGGSILVPTGTRLKGNIIAVAAEDKKKQTHALLQLSFDEMVLPDGHTFKAQALLQGLGMNEQVDADGVATIHPFSHDFSVKAGRKVWLRINSLSLTDDAVAVAPTSNPPPPMVGNAPVSRSHDNTKLSGKLGDLLTTLHEIEDPAVKPEYGTQADRHEVLITGTLKNVGKNPVCTLIHANLETSFRLDEPMTITLAGQDGGLIRELLPSEQIEARFTSSVKS